jgi:hypothetical protein
MLRILSGGLWSAQRQQECLCLSYANKAIRTAQEDALRAPAGMQLRSKYADP